MDIGMKIIMHMHLDTKLVQEGLIEIRKNLLDNYLKEFVFLRIAL